MRPLVLYKTLMQERRWGDVSALIETLTLGKKTNDAEVSALDIASLWFSLGLAALLDNAHAEAAHAFGESLRQTPDNAEIFPHLGMALQGLHKPLEAAPWYRKALAVNPEDLTSRQNLMRCLLSGGSLAEAENLLQTWPDKFVAERDLAAMYLLEVLLLRMGLRDEARKTVSRYIHSFGPSPLLETQLSLYIPPILESPEEADTLRQNIRNFFRSAKDYPNLGHPMTVQGIPPFHLAFHGKDDRELLETWAYFLQRHTTLGTSPFTPIPDEASAPIPAEVKKEDVRRRITALPDPEKRRIGFLSSHIGHHTIMSYFFRLLCGLLPRLANAYLLEFPQKDNPFRQALAEQAKLVTLPYNLEGAQKAIAALNLDILVYLDLGLDHLTWFLPFSRLAKLQCALYGHPMTTGIPELDIFLSPAPMEPPGAEKYYSEVLYALPCLLSGFSSPPSQTAYLRQEHKGHIYLCAQSLFKVHPDMDNALLSILRNDAGAELHFFVSSQAQETRALQKRLHRSLGPLSSQLRWQEQCSAQEFSAALRGADVVLDTAYFSGGSTSFKALGIGVPVLTLEGAFMRGRQTSGMYRFLGGKDKIAGKDNLGGMEELIAHSWEEYSDKALNLANSPIRRREISDLLLENNYRLFEDAESINQLEAFLLAAK